MDAGTEVSSVFWKLHLNTNAQLKEVVKKTLQTLSVFTISLQQQQIDVHYVNVVKLKTAYVPFVTA